MCIRDRGALVHHAVADHPVGLLIVGGKMLDAAAHTIALDAVDQCRAHLTAEIGVFAEILKVTSAQRAALDVQTGAKQQGQILGAALVAQRFAQLFCQSGVKAGSHRQMCIRDSRYAVSSARCCSSKAVE